MRKHKHHCPAEALVFEEFKNLINGLRVEKDYRWELYCVVSFCTAFRISDVKTTIWRDILNKNDFIKIEQKTQKSRVIRLGRSFQKRLKDLHILMGRPDLESPVLINHNTGKPLTTQYINRKLKKWIEPYGLNITNFSTHTFRKTFGRHIWEIMGKTWEALIILCEIFNHDNPRTTMIYLGIRQSEKNQVYEMIDLD